jgi:hypothetical protein
MRRGSGWPATLTALLTGAALVLVGCLGSGARAGDDPKWGPFRGRIVDADTGEPIRGAVAYAIWLEVVPNPIDSKKRFYDMKFAVTNDAGEFHIDRRPAPFFASRIEQPLFDYVAPHYQIVSMSSREDRDRIVVLRNWSRIPRGETIPTTGFGYVSFIPHERVRDVLETINTRRARMGLPPLLTLGGATR